MVQGRSDGEEDTEWVSLIFLGHICTQVYVQVPVIYMERPGENLGYSVVTRHLITWIEVCCWVWSGMSTLKATAVFLPGPPTVMELQACTPTLFFTWVLKIPTQIFMLVFSCSYTQAAILTQFYTLFQFLVGTKSGTTRTALLQIEFSVPRN